MSDTKNTGGPAFPTAYKSYDGVGGFTTEYVNGMTLRDYFAAKAMQGILAHPLRGNASNGFIQHAAAREAYEIADAMLEARE
jgi:hypothetical protein